jgi:hypothetical protein
MAKKFILIFLVALLVAVGCWLVVKGGRNEKMLMGEERVRPPVAARFGFYSTQKESLLRELYNLISSATPPSIQGELVALIVPHAGYQYSGFTAAHAYSLLAGRSYKTVVIVGPSHRAYVKGAAIDGVDAYETPLGKVPVDKEAARELIDYGSFIYFDSTAHAQEHSIEVQVPFLQVVLKDFKIVPIAMGEASWTYVQDLSGALVKLARERKDILIIASSDLSHYHPYNEAVEMDKKGLDEVLNMDTKTLYEKLRDGECEMCGAAPVLTIIEVVKKLGVEEAKLLDYRNSGDVTGDKSGVVGYSAVAFFKPQSLKSEKWLSEEEEKELLTIARETLESYLSEGKVPHFEVKSESLKEEMGAFVTLKKKGRLRGCIGHVEANKPLYEVVSEMAIAAATQDPRFSPVTLDELSEIDIEISVLSPLKKVNDIEEIKVGRDGLVIKKGFASGLLLPQVPVEWGWDREEFLRQVSLKAGLPPDAWKEADLYRFTAQVFGEKE